MLNLYEKWQPFNLNFIEEDEAMVKYGARMEQRVTAAWVHPNNKQELQLVTVKLIVVIFFNEKYLK